MTFRQQVCRWLFKGKHSPIQGDDGKCLVCGDLVKKPDVVVPPTTPDEPEVPEGNGDPEDRRQPQLSAPHYDVSRAKAEKLNHWNQLTSGGMAKILLDTRYLSRSCWATLQDAGGKREIMRHKSPSDAGARPRYYAALPGKSYKGPVKVIVQTLDGDKVYTINNPANKGG